jgi:KRAB domain-containing zinc finger protein
MKVLAIPVIIEHKSSDKLALKQHIKSQHEGKRYPCEECDYKATNKCYLKEHILTKHRGQVYSCDQSNYEKKRKE